MSRQFIIVAIAFIVAGPLAGQAVRPPAMTPLPADRSVKFTKPKDASRMKDKTPGSLKSRLKANRLIELEKWGGTKASEAAVDRGLKWLASIQERDGSWKVYGDLKEKGWADDIACTGLALLPFLGANCTREGDPFADTVAKGIAYLVGKQGRNGSWSGNLYAHGLATAALAEAYGLKLERELRGPAQMAVYYTCRGQHSAGGWRYSTNQPGDTSSTGWQVSALHVANVAGLHVPPEILQRASEFLSKCRDNTAGYSYQPGGESSPTMSAVGLLAHLQLERPMANDLWLAKGIANHVKSQPPGKLQNIYHYHAATQLMRHASTKDWRTWNQQMRDYLVRRQVIDGPLNGSWSPKDDEFGEYGGRLMVTSLSLLTLQVYYRFTPYAEPLADSD